ncbi:MAG: hypothetical protein ABI337_01590 [Nitrososphaera sp.]|jgi:hypothetical protein
MCGNVVVDLDATFGKFQFKYLDVYARGEYEVAAQILFQTNASLPENAKVASMPQFKQHGTHLRAELSTPFKAKQYCDFWAPRVWGRLAEYREKMLREYLADE